MKKKKNLRIPESLCSRLKPAKSRFVQEPRNSSTGWNLNKSLESSTGIREGILQELQNAEIEYQSLSEILNLENEKQNTRLDEKDNLLQEKTRLETEIKTLRDREMSLQANQAKLKAQVEIIAQSERNLAGFTEGSKILLEASAKGAIPGKIDPLTSRIQVKQEYETAMAAVLGEMLEGILLEDSPAWRKSYRAGRGEKGKAILISIDTDREFERKTIITAGILCTGIGCGGG